jgi:uncharacterized protein RhaS with RHS repeats
MHARFFSPVTGRFLSVDPAGGSPKFPQSWNRYAYVRGNPLKYTDPTGELTAAGIAEELRPAALKSSNGQCREPSLLPHVRQICSAAGEAAPIPSVMP